MIEFEAFILTIIFVAFVLLLTLIGMAVWLVKMIGRSTKRGKLREEHEREKIQSLEYRHWQND